MRREIAYECTEPERVPAMLRWAEEMARKGLARGPVVCRLGRPRRTLDQNAKLWPMVSDVAAQVEWHGQHLSREEWKDVFTASLKRQKVVPGLDGEFVVVGGGSSKLTVGEFSQLIELIYAFGSERDVVWSEPAKDAYEWLQGRKAA